MNLADSLAPEHHAAAPFPHYAVAPALPATAFEALVAAFPPAPLVMQGGPAGDNRRYSWSAREALDDPALDPRWREFVALHVSQRFLDGVLAALATDIRAAYPDLEARVGKPIEEWRAG